MIFRNEAISKLKVVEAIPFACADVAAATATQLLLSVLYMQEKRKYTTRYTLYIISYK